MEGVRNKERVLVAPLFRENFENREDWDRLEDVERAD